MADRSLILVTGEEGAGKSTVMRALLSETPHAAKLDAEDVGQINPFSFDASFLQLLQANVLAVITNFWKAGYPTVIAGSFLDRDTGTSLSRFRSQLPPEVRVYVVQLCASKGARDQRRLNRDKPTSREWRDRVDGGYGTGGDELCDHAVDYRYIGIDNTAQSLARTVDEIKAAIPEIYGCAS